MFRKILFLILIITIIGFMGCKGGKDMSGKNILMIIASRDFRDEELFKPKEIFEKSGAKVIVASSTTREAKGMLGAKITPDILISDVNVADYDAIVFVGGAGAKEYWDNKTAHKIAKKAYNDGKVVAAICLAPVTLANAGLLDGKKATVFSGAKSNLEAKGAKYTGKSVEVSGKIVTGNGPNAAKKFGKKVLEIMMQ